VSSSNRSHDRRPARRFLSASRHRTLPRLSPSRLPIGSDPARPSPSSTQRSDDDRLARPVSPKTLIPRLAEGHLFDYREVPDAQLCQHQYGWSWSGILPHEFDPHSLEETSHRKRTSERIVSLSHLYFSPLTKLVPTWPSDRNQKLRRVSFASTVTSASAGSPKTEPPECREIGVMMMDSTVRPTTALRPRDYEAVDPVVWSSRRISA